MRLTGLCWLLAGLAAAGCAAEDAAEVQHDLDQETAETEEHDLGFGHGYGFAIHTEHSQHYAARDDLLAGLDEQVHAEPSEAKHQYVKRVVVTKAVPYAVPQPYPVTVEKRVPYAVKVPVQVPVDKPYEVTVLKPYPVPVDRPVHYTVEKPVPYPVKVAVKVPVVHPVPYEVAKPYAVPVAVAKHYKVAVPVYVRAKEHGIKNDFPHVKYFPTLFEPQPQPQPQPAPLPQPVPQPIPQPQPQPLPQPVPHPIPQPIPQPVPQPIPHPQPQPQPHYPDLGAGGDDHHAGYSELRESFATLSTGSSDLEQRLADLRERGGSFSYMYRH